MCFKFSAFQEYQYESNKVHDIVLNNTNRVVLPFSVRAEQDVQILICNGDYLTNLCYWVIIGGWRNTKSVIRKCPTGVSPVGKFPALKTKCTIERDYINVRYVISILAKFISLLVLRCRERR